LEDLVARVQNSGTIQDMERLFGIYNYEGRDLGFFLTLEDDNRINHTKLATTDIYLYDRQTLDQAAIALAHELNNALNYDLIGQLKQVVLAGTESESDFAKSMGQIEFNGIIYQALAAGELNIPYPLPADFALKLQNYQSGAISLATLQSWAYSNYGQQMIVAGSQMPGSVYYSRMYYGIIRGGQ
jgi:hypothetical protein